MVGVSRTLPRRSFADGKVAQYTSVQRPRKVDREYTSGLVHETPSPEIAQADDSGLSVAPRAPFKIDIDCPIAVFTVIVRMPVEITSSSAGGGAARRSLGRGARSLIWAHIPAPPSSRGTFSGRLGFNTVPPVAAERGPGRQVPA